MATTRTEPALPVLPNGDATTPACWSCGDMRAANFCNACGKVQPPAPTDFFSFFGLPRKLTIDTAVLEREMYALSRRLHPDVYARASEAEQGWSLEQTSKLNDAYRTLRDPILRTEYLLKLEGVKSAEASKLATEQARTTGQKKQAVPPELLEEVFELNMQLEEYRGSEHDRALHRELEEARENFQQKLDAATAELRDCWREWDALITRAEQGESVAGDERRRALDHMVGVLNRRRYIDHLLREISAALVE
ncbi:MAG: Fe-S protein assembly co-chaperone HscB [Terriglobales bacterium]